ncbi:uncharacterized protein LOC123546846 [Mercenaria mercenaria]|uniref:uncharacterized protein LOC123546846 n=1 Tax=Mercenaria mercenaria TaxID=6596 RepID=UPI001E1E1060|nr:uncharacterized protein LOC123546846 [Mercenaria mercenaria]XP_045189396.1 uncharacterized protein LOC123546846 [Mercenaria mercenaria]
MIKLSCLLVIAGVLLTTCVGQWPLGPEFYRGMDQLNRNLNDMTVRLESMGERIARENAARQASGISVSQGSVYVSNGNGVYMTGTGGLVMQDDIRRAQNGIPFGNGGTVFITASGGLGYAYNSSDGSFTMYSLGNDSPPRGYMYHVGPHRTSFRNW